MKNKGFVPVIIFALFLIFAWMWVKDTTVEVSWEPDWPKVLKVTAESVEKVEVGADGKIGEGDLARASERAHWKAYYIAQLRVAEQLGDMKVDAETVISDLSELDQELRTSMATTIKAAREVEFSVEELDDAVRARVVVEVPGERLSSFQELLLAALRSGRLKIERSVDADPKTETVEEPATNPNSEPISKPRERGVAEVVTEETAKPALEEPTVPVDKPVAPARHVARHVPRPAPRPVWTGAVIVLTTGAQPLSAAPTIYDADGSELGNTFDLPPRRLAAGFRLVSSSEDVAVQKIVGGSPREFRATVSMGDLFLRDRLDRGQARAFRSWLKDDRIVLVLGDGKK
jgi:hypothetical protein